MQMPFDVIIEARIHFLVFPSFPLPLGKKRKRILTQRLLTPDPSPLPPNGSISPQPNDNIFQRSLDILAKHALSRSMEVFLSEFRRTDQPWGHDAREMGFFTFWEGRMLRVSFLPLQT